MWYERLEPKTASDGCFSILPEKPLQLDVAAVAVAAAVVLQTTGVIHAFYIICKH